MKEKIRAFLRQLPEQLGAMFRLHPIETLLVLCIAVGGILTYELKWEHVPPRLIVAGFWALFAFAVNNFAGKEPWRRIYWVCWMPMIPLLCWGGLEAWVGTWQCAVTAFILLPLFVLMSSRAVQNDRFICDSIIWLRSGVVAAIFANVAIGLFCAIFFSTVYIFGLEGDWTDRVLIYALIITQAVAMPVLFMMIADRWQGSSCSGNRFVEVLLNYIVTPALLIYTFILYLYILRIAVMWSLPRGGVAYMVFGFMLAAMAVQALQFLLQKRLYDWFFNRFGLISLPMLALFWAGVVRRTSEYGLTQDRVLLVVCGGLMTLCMLLFVGRRTGRYLYMCLAAFLVFAAMAYIPSLEPRRIADATQAKRALHAAQRLGALSDDGKLRMGAVAAADSLQQEDLRRLFTALDYLEYRDTVAFARFGIQDIHEFRRNVPEAVYEYVVSESIADSDKDDSDNVCLVAPEGYCAEGVDRYPVLYGNVRDLYGNKGLGYGFERDTLWIDFGDARSAFVISTSELLQHQYRKLGVQGTVPCGMLEDKAAEFLNYADDQVMILFSSMYLERRDSTLHLTSVDIDVVLTR